MSPTEARAVVAVVEPGSMAALAGVEPGDVLLSMNGHPIRDMIDYRYQAASSSVSLKIEKPDGSRVDTVIENGFDPRLGMDFDDAVFDGDKHCANKCVFCFIDQLPKGLRRTLYVKDDDYRLSFLQGNFVTLTNLSEAELHRILRLRLSPLYISVHSTDDYIRAKLIGRPEKRPIMATLRLLAEARIEFHTQIVLVPGINDGTALARSIDDLWSLWPHCASVGVVPVGLTRHRKGLAALTPFTPREAERVIRTIEGDQQRFMESQATHFVYAADEFYLAAGLPLPSADSYDGYPQLENGIGLARSFADDFAELARELPASSARPTRATVITGVAGAQAIRDACEQLNAVRGADIRLLPVANRFFGDTVTVTGLVVGEDIVRAVRDAGEDGADCIVMPDVMLRRDASTLLDDMTPDDISQALDTPVMVAEATAAGLVDAILHRN